MKIPSIMDIPIEHKKVLIRVDWNIPFKKNRISDPRRIQESLPTIQYLLNKNNTLIILTHVGNPTTYDSQYSVKKILRYIQREVNAQITFIDHIKNPKNIKTITNAPKNMYILENLRFHPGEKTADPLFTQLLASLGDIYVNEAFSVSHRNHASITGIPAILPSYGGIHFIQETANLEHFFTNAKHSRLVFIGGKKIKDKAGMIASLLNFTDKIALGGSIANTFLHAINIHIGSSFIEEGAIGIAKNIIIQSKRKNIPLLLPIDAIVRNKKTKQWYIKSIHNIDHPEEIMDIGPQTIQLFSANIKKANTIIMNGPMGKFEEKPFQNGTQNIFSALLKTKAQILIGGGDTLASFPKNISIPSNFFISTSGGAMLQFIEYKTLPGIEALIK